jgi:hypothetical protein
MSSLLGTIFRLMDGCWCIVNMLGAGFGYAVKPIRICSLHMLFFVITMNHHGWHMHHLDHLYSHFFS